MALMNWFDPVGKFNALSDQVSNTSGLSFPANTFFGWLAWALWIACLVIGVAAIVTRLPAVGLGADRRRRAVRAAAPTSPTTRS